jgi:single-strand DNA-binding protein
MASLNKVMIIGNLGRDPEVRQAGESPVANFSVAVTERFRNRDGQQQERTEWVNVVCWRRLAEIAQQYLRKGSSIYVEGKLQTRKWQDKDGNDRYTTEVVADNFQMLGGRRDGDQSSGGGQYESRQRNDNVNPFADSSPSWGGGASSSAVDDDLPF